jgi:hypothetical protein
VAFDLIEYIRQHAQSRDKALIRFNFRVCADVDSVRAFMQPLVFEQVAYNFTAVRKKFLQVWEPKRAVGIYKIQYFPALLDKLRVCAHFGFTSSVVHFHSLRILFCLIGFLFSQSS